MAQPVGFFILLGFACIPSDAISVTWDETQPVNNFSGLFGSIILERIKAGKLVKASVENAQKISFQQELVCNDCENSPVTATDTTITPQSALPTSANQLQLVNIGLSGVIVPCSKVGDIVPGPQFMLPLPQSDYDVKLDVVNSSSASAAGTTLYLSYNPATGFLRVGPNGPAIDVTQVYSAILINRKTLEQSDPFIFTAIIHTCVMHITGPKSFSVCIGIGTPYLGGYTGLNYTAENVGLLANGVNWNTVNPQTGVAIAPLPCPGGSAGPFVTACTGNCDLNQCYLIDRQTGNPEFFAKGNRLRPSLGTVFRN